jgi:hypothetical protein
MERCFEWLENDGTVESMSGTLPRLVFLVLLRSLFVLLLDELLINHDSLVA